MAADHFFSTSQYVSRYLFAQAKASQEDALLNALKQIAMLKSKLPMLTQPLTQRLYKLAVEWERILAQELKNYKIEIGRPTGRMNPFVSGNAVLDPDRDPVILRKDVLLVLENELLNSFHPSTLLLFGAHRMGKTSTLAQLPQLLGPDFALVIIDCKKVEGWQDSSGPLHKLADAIIEGLNKQRIIVQGFSFSSDFEQQLEGFKSWLSLLEKSLPNGLRVLICLDEFEALNDALQLGMGTVFLDALSHLNQHRPWAILMFVGAHSFKELGPSFRNRFIGTRLIRVSFLPREDARRFLVNPKPDIKFCYTHDALELILDITNCQPILLQTLASLIPNLSNSNRSEITVADVELSVMDYLTSEAPYCAQIWKEAGPEAQEIIRAAANGRLQTKPSEAWQWLHEREVIAENGVLRVPLMGRWVKHMTEQGLHS